MRPTPVSFFNHNCFLLGRAKTEQLCALVCNDISDHVCSVERKAPLPVIVLLFLAQNAETVMHTLLGTHKRLYSLPYSPRGCEESIAGFFHCGTFCDPVVLPCGKLEICELLCERTRVSCSKESRAAVVKEKSVKKTDIFYTSASIACRCRPQWVEKTVLRCCCLVRLWLLARPIFRHSRWRLCTCTAQLGDSACN